MPKYEYKVVPAPKKGEKAKGVKGVEDRFAHALMTVMNELGSDGWEYMRADTLPCETRSGFTGKSTAFQNMLIFRRVIEESAEEADAPLFTPRIEDKPEVVARTLPAATDASKAPESHRALGPATASTDDGKAPEVAAE
ncbi:DUF4177 domain-containing protein [Aliiroseovarius sp. YM-037]|uniref:DUF4177 domain-containing protein n=1 Tax=Aliiroseovarius sp. YM-037 TaxID=3341728 RepID=UPI003A7FB1C4